MCQWRIKDSLAHRWGKKIKTTTSRETITTTKQNITKQQRKRFIHFLVFLCVRWSVQMLSRRGMDTICFIFISLLDMYQSSRYLETSVLPLFFIIIIYHLYVHGSIGIHGFLKNNPPLMFFV